MELDLLEERPKEINELLVNLRNWDKVECVTYLKLFIKENNLKINTLFSKEHINLVFESMSEQELKGKWLIPLFQNANSVNQIFNPKNFN